MIRILKTRDFVKTNVIINTKCLFGNWQRTSPQNILFLLLFLLPNFNTTSMSILTSPFFEVGATVVWIDLKYYFSNFFLMKFEYLPIRPEKREKEERTEFLRKKWEK